MKIIIKRAFERTRQIADFVPIKAYCEATAEYEVPKEATETFGAYDKALSETLDQFVQAEVEKTLINYRPVCISCGGKGDTVILNKEGVCGNCVKEWNFKAAELHADSKKNEPPATGTKVAKPN